jgi:hypothetical protein
VVENHNSVARGELSHSSTDSGDLSGGFMAEDPRRGMGAGAYFLEISAANSAGVNAKEEFAGSDSGNWNSFKADVVHPAVNRGQHVCRD